MKRGADAARDATTSSTHAKLIAEATTNGTRLRAHPPSSDILQSSSVRWGKKTPRKPSNRLHFLPWCVETFSFFLLLLSMVVLVKSEENLPTIVAETSTKFIGHVKTPIVVLDNVLPRLAYTSLRDDLRSRTDFFEGHSNGVNFPGKIAKLDRAIVDPLLDVLQNSADVGKIYPSAVFNEQREFVTGFASILCNQGWVHNDYMDTQYDGVIAPAAVFYFGFDGTYDASMAAMTKTGTAFYREKISGLERVTSIGNETMFCKLYPDSIFCREDGIDDVGGHRDSEKNNSLRFEELHRVEGRPNRMAFYPHDVLHSAWMEDQLGGSIPVLPCSAKTGRLAISLFFLSRKSGLEIVDVYRSDWKEEATQKLKGGSDENEWESGYQQLEQSEESRRVLAGGRRLGTTCSSFTKGDSFNVVSASCDLNAGIEVNDGEELRIKGLESVDHPELQRGGTMRSPWVFRHFVMNGASKLMLLNLKLIGAWVGTKKSGCCGYCQRTVRNVRM